MSGRFEPAFDSALKDTFFLDERRMGVLVVADRSELVAAIRAVLEKSAECDFLVDFEGDLERATERVAARGLELLILDTALAGRDRRQTVDAANELASRLPVVALSGTEPFREAELPAVGERLRTRLEEADLPTLLLRTRRRARRLGASVLAPVFCRLDHPGA